MYMCKYYSVKKKINIHCYIRNYMYIFGYICHNYIKVKAMYRYVIIRRFIFMWLQC